MIAIASRDRGDLERSLRRSWGCIEDKVALVNTTAAEHMRTMIHGALAVRKASYVQTVHTTRLLKGVHRALNLMWPDGSIRSGVNYEQGVSTGVAADVLRRMESIGDVVDTGGGQWLAAPLRIIAPNNNAQRFLVVGAAPVQQVNRQMGVAPVCAGVSRFVERRMIEVRDNYEHIQSIDAWLGDVLPLTVWTKHILEYYRARMEAIEGLSADQFEIYAPEVTRLRHLPGRWISATQVDHPLDGIRLCRPIGHYTRNFSRPQYLAHFRFKDGSLAFRNGVSIDSDLSLKLRFGLDVMLNTPRRVVFLKSANTFSIERPLRIPTPENRVYALGWPDLNSDESNGGLTFHGDALPVVVRAFQRLLIVPTATVRGS